MKMHHQKIVSLFSFDFKIVISEDITSSIFSLNSLPAVPFLPELYPILVLTKQKGLVCLWVGQRGEFERQRLLWCLGLVLVAPVLRAIHRQVLGLVGCSTRREVVGLCARGYLQVDQLYLRVSPHRAAQLWLVLDIDLSSLHLLLGLWRKHENMLAQLRAWQPLFGCLVFVVDVILVLNAQA